MRPTWLEMACAEARLYQSGARRIYNRLANRLANEGPDLDRLYRLRALYGPVIEECASTRLPWGGVRPHELINTFGYPGKKP